MLFYTDETAAFIVLREGAGGECDDSLLLFPVAYWGWTG